MFKLYCLFDRTKAPTLVYTDAELLPCIQYMSDKQFSSNRCLIVSPNNTRITFDSNSIVFHSTSTYRVALHA